MRIRVLSLFLLFVLTAMLAAAQMPEPPTAQREAMKKCAFLAGQWKGEGWMMLGPNQRRTFTETENVAMKLDGLVLLLEGNGTDPNGKPIHQALGTMSFDPTTKQYRFRSYDGNGRYVETPAECKNATMTWALTVGPRAMRFTIRLNDKGQWYEIGETAGKATDWQKFFEMTLSKVQ